MTKMLWLGPAFTIAESLTSPALAPAASRWQKGFLTALVGGGADVRIVASRTERIWPAGPIYIRGDESTFHGMRRTTVPYLNLPAFRRSSLAARYRHAILNAYPDKERPDLIASYNVWSPVAQACRLVSREWGVPWIPVLLDYDRTATDWTDFTADIDGAAGVVFVSHWAFCHAPVHRKLHLDGGVDHVPPDVPPLNRSRMLLYTGALHRWGGVETLLEALPLVSTPGARLTIVGRGADSTLLRRLNSTPSVQYLGGVDEATLTRLTAEAEVLVNPRPSRVAGNEMNFPSKLLHYLSSIKPVATTMTPGVAPEYEDVVIAAKDDSPSALAAAIDRALALSDVEKTALANRIRTFISRERLWGDQARRFLKWTSDLA